MRPCVFAVSIVVLCSHTAISKEVSDFSVLVGSKYFVDKTPLLRPFLMRRSGQKKVVVMTAPSRFGKTTVLDMVKRFAGMSVMADGRPTTPDQNENYALFCGDRPLKICKYKKFVTRNFGQHPVVHIEYESLKRVKEFDGFEKQFRLIVAKTYAQHRYLAENASAFNSQWERQKFVKHCSAAGVKLLTLDEIRRAFKWLAELLCVRFRKKAVVLLDDYDAYIRKTLVTIGPYSDEIVDFLKEVNDDLFDESFVLGKAFVTGILPVVGIAPSSEIVRLVRFCGDHEYSRYFGLTEGETERLLRKHSLNGTNLNDTLKDVDRYYCGYSTRNTTKRLCNMWSVVQYLENGMKTRRYWTREQNVEAVAVDFKARTILSMVQDLIFKTEVQGNMSQMLTKAALYEIKGIRQNPHPNSDREDELFETLLYDLGYLTRKACYGDHIASLTIPDMEVYLEFTSMLRKTYYAKYEFKRTDYSRSQNALAFLNPNGTTMKDYKTIYRIANDLLTQRSFRPATEHDIQNLFLVCWQGKLKILRPTTYEIMARLDRFSVDEIPVNSHEDRPLRRVYEEYKKGYLDRVQGTIKGSMEILVLNSLGMAVIVESKFKKFEPDKKINTMKDVAKEALHQIFLKGGYGLKEDPVLRHEEFNRIKGKRYIGLAYDPDDRKVTMAFLNPYTADPPVFISSPH